MRPTTRTKRRNQAVILESVATLTFVAGALTAATSDLARYLPYLLIGHGMVSAGYLVWMWRKCFVVIFHDDFDGETRRYFGKLMLLAPLLAVIWPVNWLHTATTWWLERRNHYVECGKWDRLTDWEHLRTLEADDQSAALQQLTERRISRYRWLVVARAVLFAYRATVAMILAAVLLTLFAPFVAISILGYPVGYWLTYRCWHRHNQWRVNNPSVMFSTGNGVVPYNQQHAVSDAKYEALRWPITQALNVAGLALYLVVLAPVAKRLDDWSAASTKPFEVAFATPEHPPGSYYLRHRSVVCHVPADAIVWSPEMLN